MRPDEESKDAMGVIEMRRGMTALALAVCLSLCGGCAERQEIPVSALESSSREGMDREEGAGTIWDESGYEDADLNRYTYSLRSGSREKPTGCQRIFRPLRTGAGNIREIRNGFLIPTPLWRGKSSKKRTWFWLPRC